MADYDAMIPRIGASISYSGTAVVRPLQKMSVLIANTSGGISNRRGKLRSMQFLSRHPIGMPKTTFAVLPIYDNVVVA